MEKDLDRVLNLIAAEEIKIKQKNSIISQNTNDVIELLTSKMEYFKFKYQDTPFNERYDYIMSFLKGNFEEFDENTIKLILIKEKIYPKIYFENIETIASIIYFIISFISFYIMFNNLSKMDNVLNFVLSFVFSGLGLLFFINLLRASFALKFKKGT